VTNEELLENRRLLHIEAKYIKLERLLIDFIQKYYEFQIDVEELKEYMDKILS